MIFPNIKVKRDNENLAIQAFGKRIYEGQTIFEYLLEFLLIFISQKNVGKKEVQDGFPDPVDFVNSNKKLQYCPIPRIGLKRFIFFERSKIDGRFQVDYDAYDKVREIITKKINLDSDNLLAEDIVAIIQDLFYGFNSVIRNRSWFVQSLLPICPEVVFCESMGYKADRNPEKLVFDENQVDEVDGKFDFNGHYFMARGGEVYYLHVLQGLLAKPELREGIEKGIKRVTSAYKEFSLLACWIQAAWENSMILKESKVVKNCEWIPEGYSRRAPYTCSELNTFLSAKLYPLQSIELLSYGIVVQILRMMHEQAVILTSEEGEVPIWVIDIPGNGNPNVRKLAMASYIQCEEDLLRALYHFLCNKDIINEEGKGKKEKSNIDLIKESSENTHKLFRRLAKELEFVIPPTGPFMRFSISEKLVKFFVLSIIPPGQKITLASFLEKLYEHYRIVIGTREMHLHCMASGKMNVDYSYFDTNALAFQELLKKCGFLRDLSDATAIVENPFGKV